MTWIYKQRRFTTDITQVTTRISTNKIQGFFMSSLGLACVACYTHQTYKTSVRPCTHFDHFPEVRSSRNRSCICIFEKVASGHRFRGWPIFRFSVPGQKLVIFRHFFVLLRTPPTVLIGECWKRIDMFLVTIRKNVMRRNFEFLPSRSDNGRPRSNLENSLRQP